GFFRQYELIYIFADERDVVRVRTDYRHEDVYLYRTNFTPVQARAVLMDYVQRANALARQPQFYNALTSNCITNVVYSIRAVNPSLSIVAAIGAVRILDQIQEAQGWKSSLQPGTAQVFLATLAGSTFTFIVFVASVLLVSVQLASSQLTPRIIAGVFRDPIT